MLKSILKVHLLSLGVFAVFRLILLCANHPHWEGVSPRLILQSLLMGIRFDTVINCYILALPTLIATVVYVCHLPSYKVQRFLYYYCAILFTLAYTVSAFDIPYFNHFFSRLDKGAFQWIENPQFIVGMVAQDFRLWGYSIPFFILLLIFHYLLRKIWSQPLPSPSIFKGFLPKILISCLCLGLTFLGIRGRIAKKSPIRIGTAYFCNNAFLNKLGLNPNFTLMQSLLHREAQWQTLLPTPEALQRVKSDLGISPENAKGITQKIFPKAENLGKPNIVLILMESMQAQNMAYFGNTQRLTPTLDSLARQGLFFENAYSAGIHTFNGIFSTLMSFPALWSQHPMKQIKDYPSSIKTLAQNGYTTCYFTTHDGQFDNVEGFLMANDFQKIYAEKDYPAKEVKSTLGVPDDYMFRFGIEQINQMAKTGKPFFCTFMTASNHAPIIIPEYFKSDNPNQMQRVVQYSDWSIRQFMSAAQRQPWFENTIFVLVADHGTSQDATYDMSLSYNHIPLIFYAPHLIPQPKIYTDFVQQIDILPSLLGLTSIAYEKENMGIDIFSQNRPYAYFCADDKIGVIDNEYYYIYYQDGREALYQYRTQNTENLIQKHPDVAASMKQYAFAHLQAAHYISAGKK